MGKETPKKPVESTFEGGKEVVQVLRVAAEDLVDLKFWFDLVKGSTLTWGEQVKVIGALAMSVSLIVIV